MCDTGAYVKMGVDKTVAAEGTCHMEHTLSRERFDARRNFIETCEVACPAEPVNDVDAPLTGSAAFAFEIHKHSQ